MPLFEVLRATQDGQQVAGERCRKTHESGAYGLYLPFEQCDHLLFDRVAGLPEFGFEFGEKRDGHRDPFAVADDFEMFGDRTADQMAQVLQVERAEKFRTVSGAEVAEKVVELPGGVEPFRLRQELPVANQRSQRIVSFAEELHHCVDRR